MATRKRVECAKIPPRKWTFRTTLTLRMNFWVKSCDMWLIAVVRGLKAHSKCLKIYPTKCSQCEKLGAECIATQNLSSVCAELGWNEATACDERKPCRKLFPSACQVCDKLGPYCIKDTVWLVSFLRPKLVTKTGTTDMDHIIWYTDQIFNQYKEKQCNETMYWAWMDTWKRVRNLRAVFAVGLTISRANIVLDLIVTLLDWPISDCVLWNTIITLLVQ